MGGNHKKHTRMRLLTLRKCLNCSVEQQFSSNLFCTSTSASLPFKSSATLTTTRKDHIDITYQQTRSQVMMNAHIQEIVQLSPTIKGFTIKVDGSVPGSFKAGQWVDFFIPGLDKIGGFSMCSEPSKLERDQTLD